MRTILLAWFGDDRAIRLKTVVTLMPVKKLTSSGELSSIQNSCISNTLVGRKFSCSSSSPASTAMRPSTTVTYSEQVYT